MRIAISIAFCFFLLPRRSVANNDDFLDKVLGDKQKVIEEISVMIGNLGINCIRPEGPALAAEELSKLLKGVSQVIAEQGQTLLYKKDYPTVCHVLTQAHIDLYQEEEEKTSWKEKGWDGGGFTKKRITVIKPVPKYYWPKYFIEVTEKGNDPHHAFASGNALYSANRKIANSLSRFIDIDGPLKLAASIFAGETLLSSLNIKVGKIKYSDLMKNAILSPFEKNRIRANHQKTNPSYEAQIWPVGLSQTIAEHLTICGSVLVSEGKEPGGYSWGLKGVPMTCPVAMTKDAYSYWDTGLLDYLDPGAVAAMGAAANSISCAAAAGADMLANQDAAKSSLKGESEKVEGALSGLLKNLKNGLKTCSWPIIGSSEAIAKKVISSLEPGKWSGPYCTLWGSLAPRSSNSLYHNDYSYANSALKFKLFAHELFAVPRGRKERWSLAYPWEGPGKSNVEEAIKKVFPNLASLDLSKILEKAEQNSATKSRAESLYIPGDPRLVDLSNNTWTDTAFNIAKELAYLASITALSQKAADRAKEAYKKESGKDLASSEQILSEMENKVKKTENITARVGKQPVYGEVNYCHRSDEGSGLLYGDPGTNIDIGMKFFHKDLPYRGSVLPFAPVQEKEQCLTTKGFKGCLDLSVVFRNGCNNYNEGLAVYYRKQEIVGWIETQNPIVQRQFAPRCTFLGKYKVKRSKEIFRYDCYDEEISSKQEDSRDYVQKPDKNNAKTLAEGNKDAEEAIKAAAITSTFVTAELARAKYADITGYNPIPGNRRIYTVWEEVSCTFPSTLRTVETNFGSWTSYDNGCKDAIRHIVYKYFQTKLLRRLCNELGQREGDPWK